MIRILSIAFVLALASLPAAAQSVRNGNAEAARALLENTQIKVREWRLKPGERTGTQNYPNSFVYALTDGALVFTPPGRTPYELSFKAGEALWLPSQSTAAANETGKEVRTLVVEIKEKAPVAGKSKAKAKSKAQAAGKQAKKTAQSKDAGNTKKQ